MTINRTEIMTTAWAKTWDMMDRFNYSSHQPHDGFRVQRANENRKARHPHLKPVWDADKAVPRSVDVATVTRIAMDGMAHCFEVAA